MPLPLPLQLLGVIACVILCALSTGCSAPHAYTVTLPSSRYTAYAISPDHLVGVIHGGPRVGQDVYVHTMHGRIPAKITATDGDRVVIRTNEPLLRGDSGAGIISEDGALVASLEGRVVE